MADSKTLTVAYGTFACELEGFDDPFPLMKRVVGFYKRMSVQNPDFAQYGEMEKVDGLVQAVLNVTGAKEVDMTPIQGGVRIVNMDGVADSDSISAQANALQQHEESDADEFEYSTPVEEIEVEAVTPEIGAQSEDQEPTQIASEDAPEPIVEETLSELVHEDTPEITTSEIDAPVVSDVADALDVPEEPAETVVEEVAEILGTPPETSLVVSEPIEEVAPSPLEDVVREPVDEIQTEEIKPVLEETEAPEPTQDPLAAAAETSLEEVPLEQEVTIPSPPEDIPEEAAADAPEPSNVLRLGEETPEHVASTGTSFIDNQVAEESPAAVQSEEPLLQVEPEEDPEDDFSGTFANAMQRPSAGAVPDAENTSQPEALILGEPVTPPPSGDVAASIDETAPETSGRRLSLSSLKVPSLGGLLKSSASKTEKPEDNDEPAPLQLTPSLKVSEDEDSVRKPKSVSETVAERAEENSRRRLRIIRNEELPNEEPTEDQQTPVAPPASVETVQLNEASKPTQVAKETPAPEPIQLSEPSKPVQVEPEQAEPMQLSNVEPVAPTAPVVAEPEPLQLAEIATPAPVEQPIKAAAETPKPVRKVEETKKHDPSNEIANKLHASITSPPESSTHEMISLANKEFVDDGEMNFRNFVFRLGASTLLELMEAAAVYISLVQNEPTFERKDIMQLVDGISDGQVFSPQARIKSYGKLVRSGQVLRLEGGAFALAPDLHANYQEQMAL